MNDTKKCYRCQETKEKKFFAFKNKTLKRLQSICRTCQAKYHKKHYQENKSIYIRNTKVRNKKYKSNNKLYINEYKENKCCKFCTENTPVCLDFHHINDKKFNVSKMKNGSYSIKSIQKEIDKCILICSNCHRKLHAGIISLQE